MMPLVIEFIGLPGAGKTTIAQMVIEELTVAGYQCFSLSTLSSPESIEKRRGGLISKMRTLYQFTLSCVKYRHLARNAFLYTLHVNPFSLVSLRRFFNLLVKLSFIETLMKSNYDLLILDQGLLQNIWSIATTGEQPDNDKYLERLLKNILDEISPFVILVDVESEIAHERIARRPTMRSRFDQMSPSKAEAMLAKHRSVFEQLVDLADKFRETGFINVSGSQPISQNVSLIVPFIKQARQANSN